MSARLRTLGSPFPSSTAGPALAAALRRLGGAARWAFSMRVAIYVMLFLALASAVGTFIPQDWINPFGASEFRRRYPALGRAAQSLGLFDLYGSWWFQTAVVFVIVSVTRCVLLSRLPALLAFWRHSPAPRAQQAGRWPLQAEVGADPERIAAILRARGYRVARTAEGLAAERGRANELGSYAFHLAIVAILVAATYGKLTGFFGVTQPIVAGTSWADTPQKYDSLSRGVFAPPPRGLELAVERFGVAYTEKGQPVDFVSAVRLYDAGRLVATKEVHVNDPLRYEGVKFYQAAYGWAPVIEVRSPDGRVLAGGHVVLSGSVWGTPGVLKVPAAGPPGEQLGLELFFVPDAELDPNGTLVSASPEARLPVLWIGVWRGDLGLDRPQNVYSLDKRALRPVEQTVLTLGESATLSGGERITFAALDHWTAFAVASDPGVPWIYAAVIIGGLGLFTRLYWPHRQLFARATPSGVALSGTARPWPPAFRGEFAALARSLAAAASVASRT